MLPNHLCEALLGAVAEGLRHRDAVHDGDLFPDQQPAPVGLLQHHGVLRIVGEAEEVEAHLVDDAEVLPVRRVGDGVAEAGPILVPVCALQDERLAVEVKPVTVGLHPPNAEGLHHAIYDLPTGSHQGLDLVEVRVRG